MKKQILFAVAIIAFAFTNCKKETTSIGTGGIPDKIIVDIPTSISSQLKSAKQADTGCVAISGDSIYQNVGLFIAFGKFSAEFVQDVIKAIKTYGIDKPMDITYTEKEDGKQKHLVVVENGTFNGKNYQMKLTTTDVESGMKVMQIFWNKDQVEGVAIVHPKYFNTADASVQGQPNLMYQVEYTAVKTSAYDQQMTVSISGYELTNDPFSINNLKLTASKLGDVVTVVGNSNHPNAKFIDPSKKGFSYAFVAKANETTNIGVIKLGLPACTDVSADALNTYSVANVLTSELNYYVTMAGGTATAEPWKSCISHIISNCQSPAYYNANGYVSCGTNVPATGDYTEVSKLDDLTSFTAKSVNDLSITFGE